MLRTQPTSCKEAQAELHSNAELTPKGRLALVQAVKVSDRMARKWVQRFEAEGPSCKTALHA